MKPRPGWEIDYAGLPFLDGGRGKIGVDCWGLIWVVYKNELGIELPNYSEISAHELIRVAKAMKREAVKETWFEVKQDEIQPFDIVGLSRYGDKATSHVGLVTTKKRLMHVEAGCNTVVIDFRHIMVRERVKCFRRHQKLAQFGANLSA